MRRHNNDMLLAVTAAETDALPVSHDDMRTLFERRSSSCWSVLHQNEASRDIGDAFVEMGRRDECESLQEARVYAEVKLARVDGRLRTLIKERASLVKPLVREVEERVVDLPLGGSVVLRLPHALSRMVAHCVAQFHRLGHRSFGDGDHRFTVIHARKAVCGSVRLMDVLA